MHIVLINHYAGSPQHGMEYRPYYLAREWVHQGHSVTIIAASFAHSRSDNPRTSKDWEVETLDNIRYVWLRTPQYHGNGLRRIGNILAFVGQLFRYSRRISEACRPDLVIASSTYPLDILPAHRIARLSGAKLVFEVHDLWPLSPMELGGMSSKHPYIAILQLAEDYAYKSADWVVSLLPHADSYMISRGMRPDKFRYVPNGVDPADWYGCRADLPAEHERLIARLEEEGSFLIGYAGAHGIANGLDVVVRTAELLRDSRAVFVLIGSGPEKPALAARANALGLKNIHFMPPVGRSVVPAFAARMDAMFLSLKRSPLFRYGISPNKLMDYMMASKPVIQAIDAPDDIIGRCKCGLQVPAEDPEAIARAVCELIRMAPGERAAMGRRGREYVISSHTYSVLAGEFLKPMEATA